MIAILRSGHYRRYVGKPESSGWNSSTHLAHVDFGDGKDTPAYAKVLMDNWPALANEALGWMLTCAVGLPHPPKAGILSLPRERYRAEIGGEPPEYSRPGDYVLLWCTAAMRYRSLKFLFRGAEAQDSAYAAVVQSPVGQKITALAMFTDNPDTAAGNILRISSTEYVTIDHEHLFNCHDWRRNEPIPELDTGTTLLGSLKTQLRLDRLSEAAYRTICLKIGFCGEEHEHALATIRLDAQQLLGDLTDEAAALRVLDFLQTRTAKDWLPRQLALLAF